MIILIAGASHVGKTILAQRMLEKYKYPYLSIDHVKMGLIRSGNTDLTPEDDDELVGYLWPIIREMIKTAIESIRFICLAMSDEYIGTHFADIKEHASDVEARLDDSYCTVDQLKKDNYKVIEGYQKCGEEILLIDVDYEKTIGDILV